MTLELGTDIIEVERIQAAIENYGDRFINRLFTQKEKEYCLKRKNASKHLAGRFAAKEAIAKALGTGIGKEIGWKDIEILNDERGKPFVYIKHRKRDDISLSISHCHSYAVATAVHFTG